jgi:hypothetical protein
MALRRRWWLRAVLVVAALAVVTLAVPAVRGWLLRAAGAALVAHDTVGPADIIVVASDADGAGVLEAADLVHGGLATRVAVFADPPDPVVDREFLRRGVPYEDAGERSIRQLRALGVETVEQIPRAVVGTEDEGRVLPEWCGQHGFRSVIVVTNPDHSRRLRRVLRRAMKERPTVVTVRPARYADFDPDRWWTSRQGIRIAVVELQKLLLDLARHPFS